MKNNKYNNSPLKEVLCEFQFIPFPDKPWDLTIPGIFYEKVKENYPIKQQLLGVNYQIQPSDGNLQLQIDPIFPPIYFFNEDKSVLLQINPYSIIIHQIKNYSNWENFKKIVIENFNKFKEIIIPKGLKRITLRYVNVIEFDKNDFKFDEYFKYYPFLSKDLEQNIKSFFCRIEFPYEDNKEVLRLTIADVANQNPSKISILLDLDYLMNVPESVSFENISDWLDNSHSKIKDIFEKSITDNTRNLIK